MFRRLTTGSAVALLAALALLAACGESDPRLEVLKERQRFTVELVGWIPRDDGTIGVTVQVSGPPSTKLEQLSFRISQLDAAGKTLAAEWRTIDLAELPMGATKEMRYSVPSAGEGVEGMAAAIVPAPGPEDEPHIVELAGLPASGS